MLLYSQLFQPIKNEADAAHSIVMVINFFKVSPFSAAWNCVQIHLHCSYAQLNDERIVLPSEHQTNYNPTHQRLERGYT